MAAPLPPPSSQPLPPAADTVAADSPGAPSPLPPPGAQTTSWAPATDRPRTLTPGWRLTLALGWAGILAALGLVAQAGVDLGSPPFWLDLPVLPMVLPFLLPVLVLAALAYDWRHTLLLSLVAALSLCVVAVVDLFHTRPIGVAEAALAIGALALTTAGLAGRVRTDASEASASPATA